MLLRSVVLQHMKLLCALLRGWLVRKDELIERGDW